MMKMVDFLAILEVNMEPKMAIFCIIKQKIKTAM